MKKRDLIKQIKINKQNNCIELYLDTDIKVRVYRLEKY